MLDYYDKAEFEEINRLAIEDNISSSNVNSSNTDKEDENE